MILILPISAAPQLESPDSYIIDENRNAASIGFLRRLPRSATLFDPGDHPIDCRVVDGVDIEA